METKQLLRTGGYIRDFVAINFGLAVYSLGWAAFLLPYHITTGGLTGLFAILYYITSIPLSTSILVANAILLALSFKYLGWKFVLKTAYAVVALSFFLKVGQDIITGPDGQLIQLLGEGQDGMACVVGAILNGLGIGITFLSGGSTGGWDIIAAIVNKHRNISFGRVLLTLDLIVISSCWPIFRDWRMVVFGFITLAVYTYVLDMLINSARQDTQFIIFTHKGEEISQCIIKETCHTVTSLSGTGCYSKQGITVLITIVHKREQVNILRMIRDIDPAAFVSQSRVECVYGNGFNIIK